LENITKDAIEKLDDILTIIEDMKTPENIKKYFNLNWEDKNHPLLLLSTDPLVP
jgi:hypothetical protein